ncbi:MAG TPA: methyltransferase [Bradyrhizobium sp.]|uniref:tRNA1(Val) (adenine(37)-N6)-methyltransferase n=1 Tax=Bradyrhizobium sp. TaxID=376 RepID=UPI002BA0A6F6|nr:methyltransferase [Bradyrhizobium sp.]HLZ04377.1 methyltransferase [Bradyrhizobium sp.]
MSEHLTGITEDLFLGGRLRLRQPRKGHRAGHDAMLLAAATAVEAGDQVVEFGAGVGAAGLALARRVGGIVLRLVEIDPQLAALARDNAAANNVAADVLVLDVTASAEAFERCALKPDSVDVVLMNPPFNDAMRHRASPDTGRASAHVADTETLDGWIGASRRLLKSGGRLTLIWRADGLSDVLAALARGFGSLAILPVHADPTKPAMRVLVRAVKGGRAPTRILAGLMLNEETGVPNKEVADMLAGGEVLPLAKP